MDNIIELALAHPVPTMVLAAISLGGIAICLLPSGPKQEDDVTPKPASMKPSTKRPAPQVKADRNEGPQHAPKPVAKAVAKLAPAPAATISKVQAVQNAPAVVQEKPVTATMQKVAKPTDKAVVAPAAVTFVAPQHDVDDEDDDGFETQTGRGRKAHAVKHSSNPSATSSALPSAMKAESARQITAADFGEPSVDDGWETVKPRQRRKQANEDGEDY